MRRSAAGDVTRDAPVEYLEQLVGPFCGECNHVFMLRFDAQALPIFQRLSRENIAALRGEDISVLKAWAYKTMLVRTLLDTKDGLEAPVSWFREFHRSGGSVPERAAQFIGFLDYPTAALANRVGTIESDFGSMMRVHESSISFDRVIIITATTDDGPADAVADYREVLRRYRRRFARVLVPLEGDRAIGPDALLHLNQIDLVRSPLATETQDLRLLLDPWDYMTQSGWAYPASFRSAQRHFGNDKKTPTRPEG